MTVRNKIDSMPLLFKKIGLCILAFVPCAATSWLFLPVDGLGHIDLNGLQLFVPIIFFIIGIGLAFSWCKRVRSTLGVEVSQLKPREPMTQEEIAERIAQERVAEMVLHSAGMN